METSVNRRLINACRTKQDNDKYEELERQALESLMLEEDPVYSVWEERDDDWGDASIPEYRGPLSEKRKAELRAAGKETPDEYKARQRRVIEARIERTVSKAEQKEANEAFKELPVIAKPPREFRLMLQQTRAENKMTQEQLAQKCGVKKNVYADWEAGKVPIPEAKLKLLKKILKV
jgi:DNA-binding XRE family transcriptional regulator